MKKSLFAIAAFSLGFLFCKNEPDPNLEKLMGNWQAAAWLLAGKDAGRDASAVRFEFKNDGSYSAALGAQTEKDTFRLSGDKLYTTADGPTKIEKMVKLARISTDTLVMDMNRQGNAEQLILIKK